MDDQEASIKMAELAGYGIIKGMPCDCLVKGEIQVWVDDWNPKEDIAQAMEVLESMNMDYDIWKSSGLIDPDTRYVMYEVTIGDRYVSLEDTLTQSIFNAIKMYLEGKT